MLTHVRSLYLDTQHNDVYYDHKSQLFPTQLNIHIDVGYYYY